MPPSDPDTYTEVKQWFLSLTAGADPVNPLANNPRRNFFYIFNAGINSGKFWFDQAKDSGQAITLGPGASWPPAGVKVPINRVFCQSTLGTTFGIIEGYARGNANG